MTVTSHSGMSYRTNLQIPVSGCIYLRSLYNDIMNWKNLYKNTFGGAIFEIECNRYLQFCVFLVTFAGQSWVHTRIQSRICDTQSVNDT